MPKADTKNWFAVVFADQGLEILDGLVTEHRITRSIAEEQAIVF